MNISFTKKQEESIRSLVATGEYQNSSEVVREAIRELLRERDKEVLELNEIIERSLQSGVSSKSAQDLLEEKRKKYSRV